MTVSAEITEYPAASSDFPEDSPNLLPSNECKMDNKEAKVPVGDCDGHSSVTISNFRELSPNSGWKRKVQKADKRTNKQNLCVLESPANIRGIH